MDMFLVYPQACSFDCISDRICCATLGIRENYHVLDKPQSRYLKKGVYSISTIVFMVLASIFHLNFSSDVGDHPVIL